MKFFIKTLTGKKSVFSDYTVDSLVQEVKQGLADEEGIGFDQIRLIYGGKQMADENKVGEYMKKDGETIHMVLQLRGGQ